MHTKRMCLQASKGVCVFEESLRVRHEEWLFKNFFYLILTYACNRELLQDLLNVCVKISGIHSSIRLPLSNTMISVHI